MADKNQPGDLGASQVHDAVAEAQAQGFHGTGVDPTPNEHYTVKGVLAGKPTPETDPAHAAKVQAELAARDASAEGVAK